MTKGLWALTLGAVACTSAPEPRARPEPEIPVPARCLEHPQALVTLDPRAPRDYMRAHEAFQKGRDLQAAGNLVGARAAYQAAVDADPSHGLARVALAEAHLLTDNDVEAIRRHLAAAVLLLPENPRAHLRFANASVEADAGDAALRHWRCALELKPGLAEAHGQLGRHHLAAGRPEAAQAELEAAIAAEPDAYRYHVLLGQALEAGGRPAAAARAVERAADLVEGSAPLYRRAAELYEAAERPEEADRLRRVADRLDPPKEERDLRPLRKARTRGR